MTEIRFHEVSKDGRSLDVPLCPGHVRGLEDYGFKVSGIMPPIGYKTLKPGCHFSVHFAKVEDVVVFK